MFHVILVFIAWMLVIFPSKTNLKNNEKTVRTKISKPNKHKVYVLPIWEYNMTVGCLKGGTHVLFNNIPIYKLSTVDSLWTDFW